MSQISRLFAFLVSIFTCSPDDLPETGAAARARGRRPCSWCSRNISRIFRMDNLAWATAPLLPMWKGRYGSGLSCFARLPPRG